MVSSRSSDLTLRLNATLPKLMNSGVLADQVYASNWFLNALKEYGAVKTTKVGLEAKFDQLYEGNDTSKWMGRYENFNVEPGTEVKPALWDYKILGATAVVDMYSVNENMSDEEVWDVQKTKSNDSTAALTQTFETGLHNTGTDTKAILGIRATIADDPTSNPSAYNVGAIDRSSSTNSFWRNQYNTSAGINATWTMSSEGKSVFRKMYSKCMQSAPASMAGNKSEPTIIYLDWDLYDGYEAIHDSNDLHVRTDKIAKSGFKGLMYRNAELVPGTNSNIDGRAYFLNLNKDSNGNPLFGLYIDSNFNFKPGKWMEEVKKNILVQKVTTLAFLGGPYMKVHGVCYGGS